MQFSEMYPIFAFLSLVPFIFLQPSGSIHSLVPEYSHKLSKILSSFFFFFFEFTLIVLSEVPSDSVYDPSNYNQGVEKPMINRNTRVRRCKDWKAVSKKSVDERGEEKGQGVRGPQGECD